VVRSFGLGQSSSPTKKYEVNSGVEEMILFIAHYSLI
jgi:hypothetical protein